MFSSYSAVPKITAVTNPSKANAILVFDIYEHVSSDNPVPNQPSLQPSLFCDLCFFCFSFIHFFFFQVHNIFSVNNPNHVLTMLNLRVEECKKLTVPQNYVDPEAATNQVATSTYKAERVDPLQTNTTVTRADSTGKSFTPNTTVCSHFSLQMNPNVDQPLLQQAHQAHVLIILFVGVQQILLLALALVLIQKPLLVLLVLRLLLEVLQVVHGLV